MLKVDILNRGKSCTKFFFTLLALMVIVVFPEDGLTETMGNINILLGGKILKESDWDPLDQQSEAGVDIDFNLSNWHVSLNFGCLRSADEDELLGIGLEAETTEVYFGVKKIFEDHPMVHPYLGLGLALISTELEGFDDGVKVSDDANALGVWFSSGIYFTIAQRINIGFNLMYSAARGDLYNVEGELGGFHYHFLTGYHW